MPQLRPIEFSGNDQSCYIRSGGGFVGIHSGQRLVWAARRRLFREPPLDEATCSGGKMGADHPIAWCQEIDGGRSWYTAMGHTKESYAEPLFRLHLSGGIEGAAGVASGGTAGEGNGP